jgi:hypothetical protein
MLAPARWHKFGAVIYCEELDERKREHLVCLCLLSGSAFSWVGGTAIPWPPAGRAHSTIIRNMAGNALRTNARSAQDKADFSEWHRGVMDMTRIVGVANAQQGAVVYTLPPPR